MFDSKMIVIKYGGAAMQSEELKSGVMEDVAELASAGANVVIVHGGGPELSSLQRKLGMEPRFVEGLRYTDEGTMEAALMALCGKVNKDLARLLENAGRKAVGISGIDGGVLLCKRQEEPDIGLVGEVQRVDTGLLCVLLAAGYIPVVSTIGLGGDGMAYNINADTAAGCIAAALQADHFIAISDIPGVLMDKDDPASLIHEIHIGEVEGMIEKGVISGGMIPKARGLADAVKSGVGSSVILDGRVLHMIGEWMSGAANGTKFIK